jgi:hypothetical protein
MDLHISEHQLFFLIKSVQRGDFSLVNLEACVSRRTNNTLKIYEPFFTNEFSELFLTEFIKWKEGPFKFFNVALYSRDST